MPLSPCSRPTFRYFSWHTCLLGIAGCCVMMFLISPVSASASLGFLLLLLLALHYLSPSSTWGYISQALIFHQVSPVPPPNPIVGRRADGLGAGVPSRGGVSKEGGLLTCCPPPPR